MRNYCLTGVALVAVTVLSSACVTEEAAETSSTSGTLVTTTTSLIKQSSTTASGPGPTPDLCQPSDSSCIGPLAPGIHTTANLIMPLTFEVPEGWSKQLDVPGSVGLQSNAVPEGWIAIIPDWAIASQDNCTSDPEEGLGRTVGDLVAWLTEHQGLVTSPPSPASLGGLEGQVLDVRRDPEWNGPCSGRVSLFTHQGTINDVGWWDVNDFARLRLHFLDAGNGHTVTVHIETTNEESFERFIEVATPIVEGFEFEAAP